jgi:hypothetical protein
MGQKSLLLYLEILSSKWLDWALLWNNPMANQANLLKVSYGIFQKGSIAFQVNLLKMHDGIF